MPPRLAALAGIVALAACARPQPAAAPAPLGPAPTAAAARGAEPGSVAKDSGGPARVASARERSPVAPAGIAARAGLMPLQTTGVDRFRRTHPSYDGRGVLIAILDTGVDPQVEGLVTTSTGEPKIVDIRDFSGEGRVALAPLARDGDDMVLTGARLGGAGRVASMAVANSPWFGGWIDERAFGPAPGGDLDGDGSARGRFGVVVVRALQGWVAFIDLDGDGSLADEAPLRDFLASRTSFTFAAREEQRGRGPAGAVLNLAERDGQPVLDVVVDNAGHGTHVAGVAAGHGIGGAAGFDGVAPGAQLLALKIADNARGGITVPGSMLAAMEYAAQVARARQTPLVINVSFGIGNGSEGRAVIDSAVNAFLARHPDIVCTVSAGNDGPGLSTVGVPGSADLALSVGALYPASFLTLATGSDAGDALADFSARGAEVDKPDLVAPGVAYSTVPRWDAGEEIKAGTSFAAPHAAGLAALLISAARQDARPWTAQRVREALLRSAQPLGHASALDQGAGVPDAVRAWSYLAASSDDPRVLVRAVPMGGNASAAGAAFRREGFAGRADTLQLFVVERIDRGPPLELRLEADAHWLEPPRVVRLAPDTTTIAVRYHPARVPSSELAVGRVHAWPAGRGDGLPLFTLTSTVAWPAHLAHEPLVRHRQRVAAGQVARYFVLVPEHAGALAARLKRLHHRWPTLAVFEPDGRPVPAGPTSSDSAVLLRAQDLRAGVYEITVAGAAAGATVYDLEVAVAPPVSAQARGDTVVVTGEDISASLAGAETSWGAKAERGTALRRAVRIPEWAVTLEIDVAMPPAQWHRLTDFGVTVYNDAGERIAAEPMSYATSRMRLAVDSLAGTTVVLELYPGLALSSDDRPWSADVKIRALAPTHAPLPPLGTGRFVAEPDLLPLAEAGWGRVVEAVVRGPNGISGVSWVVTGGRD